MDISVPECPLFPVDNNDETQCIELRTNCVILKLFKYIINLIRVRDEPND